MGLMPSNSMGETMAEWKDQLEQALAPGDASASCLDAGARRATRDILSEASASNETEALLHELTARFPVRGEEKALLPKRAYLHGHTLLELQRPEEALQILLPLCEKLEQEMLWPNLAPVADEILESVSNVDVARYLAKAVEEGQADAAPEGSLRRAMELFPDEHRLCWLVAEEAERTGDDERALALFSGCLTALIESKNKERTEEVFIRLEDHEDAETTRTLLHACLKLAMTKQWAMAESHLELLLPRIKACELAREAWDIFIKLLPKAPADSALRRFLMEIAPDALPGVDGILDLLARSGLMDPKVKVQKALKQLDELLEFAPGYLVLHHAWGPGRIRAVEAGALIIDFKDKPGHRMSLAISRKSLKVIPPDDLRVLRMEDPDRVRQMVREKRTDLVYLAIRELGGKATTQELRRRLTAEIIPVSTWSTWWKDARTAMEEDERFDFSESFRQTYAIRRKGARNEADLILPRLDRRRGIQANLNLLRRFLEQYPQHSELATKMYTPVLTRWLRDEKTHPEAAVAICLLLDKWHRLDLKDLDKSLRELPTSGIEASAFADEEQQRFLASRALGLKGLRRGAMIFALGSRYPSIREIALSEMRENLPEAQRLIAEVLGAPEEHPNTALTVILATISEDAEKEPFTPSPWRAAASLCRLVDRTSRDALRDQIMRLFNSRSQLADALRHEGAPDDLQFHLADTFRRWRESERYLFPILEFLKDLGQEELVLSVLGERSQATNRLFLQQQSGVGYDDYYLTRATYTQLEEERNNLSRELKTTVTQALQSAREHGDLSENAEYDAAKEKQANHIDRIREIGQLLGGSTLIEKVTVPEGEIGPGSWVELRITGGNDVQSGERLAFWLLGEGDSRFGPEAISSMAPVARTLMGKKVGDQIGLQLSQGDITADVISIEQRLPE